MAKVLVRRATRRVGRAAGVALVAGCVVAAMLSGATSAGAAGNDGSITVRKVGDRAADGTLVPLAGATYDAYTGSDFTGLVGSCTTVAPSGQCTVANLAYPATYYVREATAPAPFQAIGQVQTTGGGLTPYFEAVSLTDNAHNATTRQFVNRRTNPAFPSQCGVNVALVVDRSNSIDASELATMKTAGTEFAQALVNTPSTMSVYSFGATATQNLSATSVSTQGGVNTVQAAINGLTTGGGFTNWDGAFRTVAASGDASVVIILTDGNPTVTDDIGFSGGTQLVDIEAGAASANLVKSQGAQGTSVLAVGIGNDVSGANLQTISGPTLNHDYFVTDFSALLPLLTSFATALCGAHVTITKNLDGAPANGWTFTPATSTQGVTVGPTPGTTSGSGQVAFTVNGIPDGGAAVTFTETQQGGTSFVSGTCDNGGTVANGVAAFTVQRGDDVSCTFDNAHPNLSLEKSGPATVAPGGEVEYTVTVTNHGPGPSGAISVSDDLPDGLTLVSAEGTGWTCGDTDPISCTHASIDAGTTASFTVTADAAPGIVGPVQNCATVTDSVANDEDDTSCTTADVTPAVNLTVAKGDGGVVPVAGGANGSDAVPYSLTVRNLGPSDATANATVTDVLPAGVVFQSFDLPSGVTCSGPAGQTITCTIPASMLHVADPPVVIGVNVTVANGVTNAVVNKTVVSSRDDPAPCTVTDTNITCDPADTDNFASVSTGVIAVAAADTTTGATTAATTAVGAALAFTGSHAGGLAVVAVGLCGLGAGFVLVARRRRRAQG